jgi:hypothetical protein
MGWPSPAPSTRVCSESWTISTSATIPAVSEIIIRFVNNKEFRHEDFELYIAEIGGSRLALHIGLGYRRRDDEWRAHADTTASPQPRRRRCPSRMVVTVSPETAKSAPTGTPADIAHFSMVPPPALGSRSRRRKAPLCSRWKGGRCPCLTIS